MKEEQHGSKYKKAIKSLAVLAITLYLIMSFVVSAYRIPTGSMERTLRVGDMLLVNKFIYGFRTPDWFGIPFTEKIGFDIPYFKTPLFKAIKQGDVVVFKHFDEQMNQWLYYVKRCVALPGQTVEVIDKELFVDGKKFSEFYKTVEVDAGTEDLKANARFEDENNFNSFKNDSANIKELTKDLEYLGFYDPDFKKIIITRNNLNQVINFNNGYSLKKYQYLEERYKLIFPQVRNASLSEEEVFDNVKEGDVYKYFNSRDSYRKFTVPKGSYFMMGDNRDNSYDSRYWGFVTEDFIVGKPIMVYFSFDYNKNFKIYELWKNDFTIRWDRIGYFIQ